MPVFKIQAPDGSVIKIEAADRATAMRGAQEHYASKQQPATPRDRALVDARKRVQSAPGQIRAISQGASFGFSDELEAGAAALETGAHSVFNRMLGKPDVGYGMEDAYGAVMQAERERKSAFTKARPVQAVGLEIAGGFAAPGSAGAARFVGGAPNALGTIARSALTGTAMGAAYGAGNAEGGVKKRAVGAAKGAAVGAATGAAAPLALNAAQTAGRAINAATGQRLIPAAQGAAGRLRRALQADGVDRRAVNAAVGAWQRAGNDAPALIDVAGNNTMRLIRNAASQPGNAQNVAERYARTTRQAAGQRGQRRAEAIVPDGPSAPQTREFLEARRGQLASQEYAGPYGEMVAVDQRMVDALQDAPGMAALNRARQTAIAHRAYDEADEIDRLIEARARPQASLAAEIPMLRAGTVDRIYRQMRDNGMALGQNPGTRSMGVGVANRARDIDATLGNVEGLRPARATYQNLSRAIDAVDTGATVRKAPASQFVPAIEGATPEVRQAATLGARQQLVDDFGNKGQPPGMFEELASEPNLMDNLRALLGPAEQQRLATFGENEATRLARANQQAPNTNSQTHSRGQDDGLTQVVNMFRRPLEMIMTRLTAGATLTDVERELLVTLGVGNAPGAMTAMQPRALQVTLGDAGARAMRALPSAPAAAAGATEREY